LRRERHRAELSTLIVDQLVRCFGSEAKAPRGVFIEDWATNARITRPEDLSEPQHHPRVGPSILRDIIYRDRLAFASAETSRVSPGVLEGAFHAAEAASDKVLSALDGH